MYQIKRKSLLHSLKSWTTMLLYFRSSFRLKVFNVPWSTSSIIMFIHDYFIHALKFSLNTDSTQSFNWRRKGKVSNNPILHIHRLHLTRYIVHLYLLHWINYCKLQEYESWTRITLLWPHEKYQISIYPKMDKKKTKHQS